MTFFLRKLIKIYNFFLRFASNLRFQRILLQILECIYIYDNSKNVKKIVITHFLSALEKFLKNADFYNQPCFSMNSDKNLGMLRGILCHSRHKIIARFMV